jgi:superfamily II DNA or RNA helicase
MERAPLHKCLTKRGYQVIKQQLTAEQRAMIVNELNVQAIENVYAGEQPKYKIYLETPTCYLLPKFYGLEKFGPPQYLSQPGGAEMTPGIKMTGEPLPHQTVAVEVLKRIYNRSNKIGDGGVLSLACGLGKTFLAIWTAVHLGLRTLIVVNKEDLLEQWAKSIKTFVKLPEGEVTIGRIQGQTLDIGPDFTIAMIHSLSQKDYSPELFKEFGFLICDETHHLSSEMFSQALLKVRPKFTLGLSATPVRKDGLSNVFHYFLGPIIHKQKREGISNVQIKQLQIQSDDFETKYTSRGTKDTVGMISSLCENSDRDRLIHYIISSIFKDNRSRKILLLSSRRNHLSNLFNLLTAEKIYKSEGQPVTFGLYLGNKGGNREAHRKMLESSAKCDIILGTDAIAEEGLDIPDLNCLIFASPAGTDVEQAVGRILRKIHKDVSPLVVDLVDKCGNFVQHASKRCEWYEEENYVVAKQKVILESDYKSGSLYNFITTTLKESAKVASQRTSQKIHDGPQSRMV